MGQKLKYQINTSCIIIAFVHCSCKYSETFHNFIRFFIRCCILAFAAKNKRERFITLLHALSAFAEKEKLASLERKRETNGTFAGKCQIVPFYLRS
jgi:hypothetical protein